jgi:protein O-mannosyl-transferase
MDLFFKSIVQSRWLGFTLIMAVVLTAYSFMMQAPFRGMDDRVTITQNADIRNFENIPKIFTSSFFGDRSYYRPLVSLSYMLEYHLFGLNSFFFNLDNVLIHILNAFGVYFLIFRLMKDRALALAVSFVFAIHPVHWEAVANISGRVILLNTLFLLAAFSWFIDFRERRKFMALAGSLVSFLLAFLCKESAAIFPLVLVLYLALFPSRKGERLKPWLGLAPFFVIIFGMILFRQTLGITQLFGWGSFKGMLLGFLTFACGAITYIRILIWPTDLYFDRSAPLFYSFTEPQLLATVVFWLAALWLVVKRRVKMGGRALFFILWFLIELAPVSQVVTSLGVQPGFISLAEHFLYVPSIAFLTLAVLGIFKVMELNAAKRWFSQWVGTMALIALTAFFFLTTIQQNIYASNELDMLKRSVKHQPFNSRVLYSMGMYYANRGMFEEAERYFGQAVAIDPWNVRAMIALGKSLCDQGRYIEGIAVYESIQDAGNLKGLLDDNLRRTREIAAQMPRMIYE